MKTPLFSLPLGVEQRLSGWIRIQQKQGPQAPDRQRPCITLSRQFGCEGFPAALRLQERLEAATGEPWTIFDRALIDQVAQDEGISRQVLSDPGDAANALEAFGFHPRGAVTSLDAYGKMALFIAKVAQRGNAIIVGRGGAVICHDLPNVYHFRLVAGFDWRVEAVIRRLGITRDEAVRLVKVQSKQRNGFIKEALGADVEDPAHYDAIFNNERHSLEEIATAICAYVRVGWEARNGHDLFQATHATV